MKPLRLLLSLLFLYLLTSVAKAQTADSVFYKHNTGYVWVSEELGAASPGRHGAGSINVLINSYLYTVKASLNDGLNRHGAFYTDEYALLFGKKLTRNPFGNFIASAGVSLVKVTNNDEGTYTNQLGVPLQIQYLNNVGLAGWAGFSVGAGVNINRGHSFAVFTVGIALGNLRERGPKKK